MNFLDMHCDTIYRIHEKRFHGEKTCLKSDPELCINLEKMQKAGYLLQNFAAFVDLREAEERFQQAPDAPYRFVTELVDLFQSEMENNRAIIHPVTTWEEIRQNQEAGILSALLTVEEGGVCLGDLEKLHTLYSRGTRMMTLTWNYENKLGFPSCLQSGSRPYHAGEKRSLGLKEKGLVFVSEMERLGMIVDVSHLSDDGFFDVCEHAQKPFVASHSNARSLCGHCRNLTDEMIRMLGEHGGVTGLNLCPDFVLEEGKRDKALSDSRNELLEALAEHAVHIMNVGGSACIGLGTDFDGFGEASAPRDAAEMQDLTWVLHKHHVSDDNIDGILYRNVLNLYRELLR